MTALSPCQNDAPCFVIGALLPVTIGLVDVMYRIGRAPEIPAAHSEPERYSSRS